ncbi:hypothetical protein [Psychroserpens algicola]|uniref:Uncharacterized protein n=1 Tax=Psychroserpens algicola TaxID=1719034 RepID=A0ABT0H3Q9_9FLAO|nr:hypothetical protein [Psychroserpens algicola]MCK8479013.1 hypothetical protein [Psychroserpens algicola]
MKNKKKTYVLLALVLIVWGTVVYRVIVGLNPDLPELDIQQAMQIKDFKFVSKIDTFSIQVVDRDPFLGTRFTKKVLTTNNKKRIPLIWHPIEYFGILQSNETKQQIFIVKIKGKQYLLKKGQTMDSIRLLYGNAKRITLDYKNQQKVISRKAQ